MPKSTRRAVTGHDARGRSVVLSDAPPPQHHLMHGLGVGADFHEMWSEADTIPELTTGYAREPNERPFTIMPVAGHLLRILDVYPLKDGGKRTVMHRTRTLDYVVVIEGELVLILDDSEVILKPGDVVVQRVRTTPGRIARGRLPAQRSSTSMRVSAGNCWPGCRNHWCSPSRNGSIRGCSDCSADFGPDKT
jgi:hypothetical protein